MAVWYGEPVYLGEELPNALAHQLHVSCSPLKPSVLITHLQAGHALRGTGTKPGWDGTSYMGDPVCFQHWWMERGEEGNPCSQWTVAQSTVLQASLVSDPKLCGKESVDLPIEHWKPQGAGPNPSLANSTGPTEPFTQGARWTKACDVVWGRILNLRVHLVT